MNGRAVLNHVSLVLTVILACLWRRSLAQSSSCSYTQRPHPQGFCGETLTQLHSNVCFLLRSQYPEVYGTSSSSSGSNVRRRSVRSVPANIAPSKDFRAWYRLKTDQEKMEKRGATKAELMLLAKKLEIELGLELENFIEEIGGEEGREAADRWWADYVAGDAQNMIGSASRDTDSDTKQGTWLDLMLNKRPSHFPFTQHHQRSETRQGLAALEMAKRKPSRRLRSRLDNKGNKRKRDNSENSDARLSRGKRNLVCECCYSQCTISTLALYC